MPLCPKIHVTSSLAPRSTYQAPAARTRPVQATPKIPVPCPKPRAPCPVPRAPCPVPRAPCSRVHNPAPGTRGPPHAPAPAPGATLPALAAAAAPWGHPKAPRARWRGSAPSARTLGVAKIQGAAGGTLSKSKPPSLEILFRGSGIAPTNPRNNFPIYSISYCSLFLFLFLIFVYAAY